MGGTVRVSKRRARWLDQRRKRFKAALAHGGFTIREFCKRIQVTHSHLNFCLRGERTSEWVDSCVRKIIKTELNVDIGEAK